MPFNIVFSEIEFCERKHTYYSVSIIICAKVIYQFKVKKKRNIDRQYIYFYFCYFVISVF